MGGVGRRGKVRTTNINNSKEKQKNEGKQKFWPCRGSTLRSSIVQGPLVETMYLNIEVTPELRRANQSDPLEMMGS